MPRRNLFNFFILPAVLYYETITLLIIFYKNNWISEKQLDKVKNFAEEIGKMLSSLINSIKSSMN
ncbi:MAG: hypothetical protein B6D55_05290 [Candidatus Omnitrophica bacterium 4484_70.2]|nr:MAG: hypothetical protein B6D55_05290 [Candidatus Omnitrophica bacterium 4484_70.2]